MSALIILLLPLAPYWRVKSFTSCRYRDRRHSCYKNVLNNPMIRIDARGAESEFKVIPVADAPQVSSVVEKFRAKYGINEVKKYHSKFDDAVIAQIP